MISNDGGGGIEIVRSSGGRSFQRRGAVIWLSGEHEMGSDWGLRKGETEG